MSQPEWASLDDWVARALELPTGDRAAFLDSECRDESLRRQVTRLLASQTKADRFFEHPELESPHDRNPASAGNRVGAYEILDEIGRGGMGVVYRARRCDGEYQHEVAVKFAGGRLFAPEADRRFIRERQILAQLDHPNIVRLLDGGVTAGQRYLVMELVEGVPITAFARTKPLADRLRLFLDVCAAIHYAHQRMILHRDLKPGNILVTADGAVKVLDFGIAQLLTEETGPSITETALHPLSLACASPEQARGEQLSLASDVYSLGVLLYALATGENPQHREGMSYQETLSKVLDENPPPPSRRAPGIGKDLDAVVGKALTKNPRDRYTSAAELRSDLERYLQGRPVQAVPPRKWYLFRRFVSRNKVLCATAAALLASVAVGAGVYVRQAQVEARRFEDARRLIRTVIHDIQPKMEAIPATLPLRKTLIEETMKYLESVSRDAAGNLGLLQETASAYRQLSRILGDANYSNLGDQGARSLAIGRAEELTRLALERAPSNPGLLRDAAELHGEIAGLKVQDNLWNEAREYASRSKDYAERAMKLIPDEIRTREALARSHFWHGVASRRTDWKAAVASLLEARKLSEELARRDPRHSRSLDILDRYLSSIYRENGDESRAVAHARSAFELSRRALEKDPLNQVALFDFTIVAMLVGEALVKSDPRESVSYFRQAAEVLEKMLSQDPGNSRAQERLAEVASDYGGALLRAGDAREARRQILRSLHFYQSLSASGRLLAGAEQEFAEALNILGDLERSEANHPAACASYQRSVDKFDAAGKRSAFSEARKREIQLVRDKLASCR